MRQKREAEARFREVNERPVPGIYERYAENHCKHCQKSFLNATEERIIKHIKRCAVLAKAKYVEEQQVGEEADTAVEAAAAVDDEAKAKQREKRKDAEEDRPGGRGDASALGANHGGRGSSTWEEMCW